MADPEPAYSPARIVSLGPDAHLVYISVTTARQPDGQFPPFGAIYRGSLATNPITNSHRSKAMSAAAIQTDIIFSKIADIIQNASGDGTGLESLVDLTIYMKNPKRDYAAVNQIYEERVATLLSGKGIPLPARTCVEGQAVPVEDKSLVEIKAVAKLERIQSVTASS